MASFMPPYTPFDDAIDIDEEAEISSIEISSDSSSEGDSSDEVIEIQDSTSEEDSEALEDEEVVEILEDEDQFLMTSGESTRT